MADEGEQDSREIAKRYRQEAAETKNPAKQKELESYANDIEAQLIAAEPDQQEG